MINLKRIFAELKRRNVYRAAVLYGMSAWLLAQITTQIFPFFNVPNSAVRFVIIALILGFPIAMALSWLYELTPGASFAPKTSISPRSVNLGAKSIS